LMTPMQLQKKSVKKLRSIVIGRESADLKRGKAIGTCEALKKGSLLQDDIDYGSLSLQPLAVAVNVGIDGQYGQDYKDDQNQTAGDGGGYLDPSIPPWHPSMGCDLPPLPRIYMPNTAEERLHNPDSKRLKFFAWKGHCEGPTDRSCYIIPGIY